MGCLVSDIRYAIRALRRNAGLTCYILAIIALGIGANTAMFSVVSAALLQRLPWRDADRIVSIRQTNRNKQITDYPLSTADYLEWKDHADSFELTSGFLFRYFNISGKDSPERVEGLEVDADFLPLLGIQPLHGRNFTPQETEPGNEQEVILTYRLWERRFASDPDILGRKVTIEGTPYVVVGVLPSNFWMFKILNHDVDVFVPLPIDPHKLSHDSYDIGVYGKLKPGVTIQQAQSQLDSIYLDLEQKYPATNATASVRLVPAPSWNGPIRSLLILLLTAVGLVLLIACANIANLLTARAASRGREIAIRQAVGASRWRVGRQLLTESLILSVTGGTAGLAVPGFCMGVLNGAIPYTMVQRAVDFHIDTRVLLFALALSIITGLVFGLLPAISCPRTGLSEALKDAGFRGGAQPNSKRSAGLLVTGEIALTVVLLAGAALVIKSALRVHQLDRGLDSRNILIMQAWLPRARYPERWQVTGFYQQVLKQISLLPGVQSASLVNFPPLDIISPEVGFTIAGRNRSVPGEQRQVEYKLVDPDYFRTLRIPLIEGRCFTDSDSDEAHGVAMISRSLARSLCPSQSPIGNRIVLQFPQGQDLYWIPESSNLPLSIVGVVGDLDKEGLQNGRPSELYLPYMQNPSRFMHLIMRTGPPQLSLADAVAGQIRSVDNDEPVFEIRTMDDVMSRSFSASRISSLLLGVFAALALVIASLGIYSVVSYTVARRTSEIGIRMAIGASRLDILRVIVGPAVINAAGGILAGLLGTMAATRLLRSSLTGVVPSDPATELFVAAIIGFVSLLAAYVPARRAMNVDPARAIRCE